MEAIKATMEAPKAPSTRVARTRLAIMETSMERKVMIIKAPIMMLIKAKKDIMDIKEVMEAKVPRAKVIMIIMIIITDMDVVFQHHPMMLQKLPQLNLGTLDAILNQLQRLFMTMMMTTMATTIRILVLKTIVNETMSIMISLVTMMGMITTWKRSKNEDLNLQKKDHFQGQVQFQGQFQGQDQDQDQDQH